MNRKLIENVRWLMLAASAQEDAADEMIENMRADARQNGPENMLSPHSYVEVIASRAFTARLYFVRAAIAILAFAGCAAPCAPYSPALDGAAQLEYCESSELVAHDQHCDIAPMLEGLCHGDHSQWGQVPLRVHCDAAALAACSERMRAAESCAMAREIAAECESYCAP